MIGRPGLCAGPVISKNAAADSDTARRTRKFSS